MPTESRPPIVHRLGWWWLVAACLAVGIGFAATGHILRSGLTLAGGTGLGALLRLVLPEGRSGGLVVRSRAFDVATLAALALALGALTLLLDLRRQP